MSMIGRWLDNQHAVDRSRWGDARSYQAAAEWMDGCATVEDWGCGPGFLKTLLLDDCAYLGVDGSATPYTDLVADLVAYRSTCEGLVLRHVLEHNHEWATILGNAVASFTRRLCIILFTPLSDMTHVLVENAYSDAEWHTVAAPTSSSIPDISFRLDDILSFLPGTFEWELLAGSGTHYQVETIIRAER